MVHTPRKPRPASTTTSTAASTRSSSRARTQSPNKQQKPVANLEEYYYREQVDSIIINLKCYIMVMENVEYNKSNELPTRILFPDDESKTTFEDIRDLFYKLNSYADDMKPSAEQMRGLADCYRRFALQVTRGLNVARPDRVSFLALPAERQAALFQDRTTGMFRLKANESLLNCLAARWSEGVTLSAMAKQIRVQTTVDNLPHQDCRINKENFKWLVKWF